MKSKILTYIESLEKENNIKVLLACETGSRGWGFPSIDSDYDVRLIYMHPKDWYVSLKPKTDYINRMYEDNLIDITGWDLRKSYNLLYRSNASLIERVQSPEVYISDSSFLRQMSNLANDFYAPISIMYHYMTLSKKMMAKMATDNTLNLKKFFYALRSSLVCKWVLDRADLPPISIFDLMDGLNIEPTIKKRIIDLIALKARVNEAYCHTNSEVEICNFIHSVLAESDLNANQLSGSKNKTQVLDSIFLDWLA